MRTRLAQALIMVTILAISSTPAVTIAHAQKPTPPPTPTPKPPPTAAPTNAPPPIQPTATAIPSHVPSLPRDPSRDTTIPTPALLPDTGGRSGPIWPLLTLLPPFALLIFLAACRTVRKRLYTRGK